MCLPVCLEQLAAVSNRREFCKTAALTVAAVVAPTAALPAASPKHPESPVRTFTRVIDLTHTLTPDFPTWSGQPQLTMETLSTLATTGWNVRRWHIAEHTGTHLDAPCHKSDKDTADLIPAQDLVGPLAVVDIRQKASDHPDSELTLDDLRTWEARHGPLPEGGIVAMHSGWDAHVRTARFRNADPQGRLHFPGFHAEAADFLLAERHIKGIVVDTLSLDHGLSTAFPVHVRWLASNRWGLECAANLGALPPKGATIIVGGPKIAGATGGPSRVLALL